jgi:hypothetical protein
MYSVFFVDNKVVVKAKRLFSVMLGDHITVQSGQSASIDALASLSLVSGVDLFLA